MAQENHVYIAIDLKSFYAPLQKNGQRPGQVNPKKAGHTALPA
ncbi:hypothetical protein IMSAGC003_00153 [Lachnospiraceae bacterium]|nr:hypothetical protein IMSAGC003_00153 [Lachnospiraceae bacterium]